MNDFDTIIIGGGLSGLTVAHKLRLNEPDHKLLVLEKSSATGGVIQTHNDQGYIAEIGPHGFLDNCQESKDILRETGLDKECVKAPLIEFVRYVYHQKKLKCIPQTPLKISMAPLIPWSSKFRVVGEAFKKPLEGEPTVAKWVNHRFGPAMLPYADAVFTGTYAGDIDRLCIDAVMPGVRKLEKEHGSVISGVLAKMKARKGQGKEKQKLSMPAMTSFPSGMQRLVERLTEPLTEGKDLLLNTPANYIFRTEKGWLVKTASEEFTTTNLVLALPANPSLKLLEGVVEEPPEKRIPEAWISTVVFGFGPGNTLPPGFGFLVPESEKKFILGSLFTSNMFPGRAPEGHILFETLIGGRRHPERLKLGKEEIIKRALAEVQEILDITDKPMYTSYFSADSAIPQLEKGYTDLLGWRDEIVARYRGLHLCGFGWEGIGLNDMMKTATRVSEALLASRQSGSAEAEVKKVYF